MVANTITLNQQMSHFDHHNELWLFGYGSLIYKVDFPYLECKPAAIEGWSRRFWQGSHDHRGTEFAPGRVVTLVAEPHARCLGMAYLISPQVFEHLDFREKNGYLRLCVEMEFEDKAHAEGVVYIAAEDNAAFLGPATELEIACHIASAEGPSGTNADYLLKLAAALRELGAEDSHVFAIEQHLHALGTP